MLLLYDEPGRCGGMDSHRHHFRVTQWHGSMYLLVQHGEGDERIRLHENAQFVALLAAMDSTARYWTLAAMYYTLNDAER